MNVSNLIAIISNDAGGAEVLSSYVAAQNIKPIFSLTEPAYSIFQRKLGPIKTVSIEEAVGCADFVLTGTGWNSDNEFNAIKLAKESGKTCASFIDHWVNYKERFVRGGAVYLPDVIWVGDKYAYDIAKKTFPSQKIEFVENPYFLHIKNSIKTITKNCFQKKVGLFISEPISHYSRDVKNSKYLGFDEFDALLYLLENIKNTEISIDEICIRLHPSDQKNKYDVFLNNNKFPLRVIDGGDLIDQIVSSEVVFGCQSMGLVVALIAGKRVVRSIPPGGCITYLPHEELEYLDQLIANK